MVVADITNPKQQLVAKCRQSAKRINLEGACQEADVAVCLAVAIAVARLKTGAVIANNSLTDFIDGNRPFVIVEISLIDHAAGNQHAGIGIHNSPTDIGVTDAIDDGGFDGRNGVQLVAHLN